MPSVKVYAFLVFVLCYKAMEFSVNGLSLN